MRQLSIRFFNTYRTKSHRPPVRQVGAPGTPKVHSAQFGRPRSLVDCHLLDELRPSLQIENLEVKGSAGPSLNYSTPPHLPMSLPTVRNIVGT